MDLHLSKRLQDLLPKLTDEERKQLKENIEADKCLTEALTIWHDGEKLVVIDGMHRWPIVRGRDDIRYQTRQVEFANYEEAELWILNHQLGRRNLLKPAAVRKIRGELYNRLKRQDKGHGDQKSESQRGTPIRNAATEVAKRSGVGTRTVKRDGARVAAISSLIKPAQTVAEDATDAEVKALAKLDEGQQAQIARAIRVGQASSVSEAIKVAGFKPPAKEKPKKPEKQFDRSFWFKQWQQQIGPLVRLVDKIGHGVGQPKCESKTIVLEHLEIATAEMMDWMKMKK